jgi:hypothetical protein
MAVTVRTEDDVSKDAGLGDPAHDELSERPSGVKYVEMSRSINVSGITEKAALILHLK